MSNANYTVRLNEAVRARADRHAKALGMSRAEYFRFALVKELERADEAERVRRAAASDDMGRRTTGDLHPPAHD